jgi:hypothetical protein
MIPLLGKGAEVAYLWMTLQQRKSAKVGYLLMIPQLGKSAKALLSVGFALFLIRSQRFCKKTYKFGLSSSIIKGFSLPYPLTIKGSGKISVTGVERPKSNGTFSDRELKFEQYFLPSTGRP